MTVDSLEELIQNRKDWLEINKRNKFNFDILLARPYSEPAHFIFELLQNADDAGATQVQFELRRDGMDMWHNASRDFNLSDIEGVTGIGNSTKENELTPIGKFGLGFKSVFAVTNSPIIYSGKFRIRIEDFVLPTPKDGPDTLIGTQIILPFNGDSMSNDKAYEIIGRMLMNLGSSTILFLNNIREIKWKTIDSNGLISKSIKKIPKASRTKRVKISTDVNQEEFLVVHKPINLDGVELRVEVAYRIGKNSHNKTSIKPLEKPSKLIVYFPTEKETHLNFYIHGPYRTTPNRENIPLDDEQNKHIIDATANLVAESIHMIKKIGLLDVDFLNVMPLDSEKVVNYIYSKIFNQVKDKLLSEKLLPTLDSKYGRPSDVVLPKRHDITSLLNHKDLNLMFSKKYWISSDIEYYATEHLKQYLTKDIFY